MRAGLSRYVPGLQALVQVGVDLIAPAATSVANDCTRGPCGGGEAAACSDVRGRPGDRALGAVWLGLGVVVARASQTAAQLAHDHDRRGNVRGRAPWA